MPISRNKPAKIVHEHTWMKGFNDSEMKCLCGELLVSAQEHKRRKEVWLRFFENVRQTRAYERFIEQKDAMRSGDLATVKKLATEAKNDLKDKTDWLEKPHFPDPTSWNHYTISGEPDKLFNDALDIFSEPVGQNAIPQNQLPVT